MMTMSTLYWNNMLANLCKDMQLHPDPIFLFGASMYFLLSTSAEWELEKQLTLI